MGKFFENRWNWVLVGLNLAVYIMVGALLFTMPKEHEVIDGETLEPQLSFVERLDRWGVPKQVLQILDNEYEKEGVASYESVGIDRETKEKIRAKFVKINKEKIVLEKFDGGQVEVELGERSEYLCQKEKIVTESGQEVNTANVMVDFSQADDKNNDESQERLEYVGETGRAMIQEWAQKGDIVTVVYANPQAYFKQAKLVILRSSKCGGADE